MQSNTLTRKLVYLARNRGLRECGLICSHFFTEKRVEKYDATEMQKMVDFLKESDESRLTEIFINKCKCLPF